MKKKFCVKEIFSLFTRLLTNIQRCINKIKNSNMKALGLKSGYVSCLYYLYKMGAMSQTELCEICNEDKASISRKLEYLTKNGYVSRELNESANKYKLPIVLTKKGEEIANFIDKKVSEIIIDADSSLKENEREILYFSLGKINDKLQQLSKVEVK